MSSEYIILIDRVDIGHTPTPPPPPRKKLFGFAQIPRVGLAEVGGAVAPSSPPVATLMVARVRCVGRGKKTWAECVKDDMKLLGLNGQCSEIRGGTSYMIINSR